MFIAAGATVKPSLVFFKRFTEEEELEYARVSKKAYLEMYEKYREEADKLLVAHKQLCDDGKSRSKEAKAARARLEEIVALSKEEAKPLVKQYFDYEIPIAKVDDAGITSTGAASAGNQLPALEAEYANYRISNQLWAETKKRITYKINDSGDVVRVMNGKEVTLRGEN